MYQPSIFISHSAKEPSSRSLLTRLYRVLRKDFDVLLDRERLRPNNEWRKELNTWIGLCQGAVALISESALTSGWVKKEIANLEYRREMDETFILVPVLLPPVTPEMLKQGDFAPLELGAIQGAAGTTDEIVDQVREALKPLHQELERGAPLRKVERSIGNLLVELGQAEQQPLLVAAGMLGKKLRWRPDESYGHQLARELLSADLELSVKILNFLAQNIAGSGKKLAQILDLLSPFWVDPDAVLELPRMNTRPRRQRAVKVNGTLCPFTGRNYIRRARADRDLLCATVSLPPNGWQEVSLEARVDQMILEIQRQLELGFEEDERPTAADIEQRLALIEKTEPMFVLVPRNFDEDVLSALRQRLESFTFFMLGEKSEFDSPQLQDWEIVVPQPELPSGHDQTFSDLIGLKRSQFLRTK